MAQNAKSKSIPVWVNAGEKAITFARRDGQNWVRPLFVNAPNGTREAILEMLCKVDGKATRNITWEMPKTMVQTTIIQKGDNAGKMVDSISISIEFLESWLNELVVTKRGAVQSEVKDILKKWNPTIEGADDDEEDDNLEDF